MTHIATTQSVAGEETSLKPALESKQFLTFQLAGEVYGVDILSIREIIDTVISLRYP